jgi:hypothetical protein
MEAWRVSPRIQKDVILNQLMKEGFVFEQLTPPLNVKHGRSSQGDRNLSAWSTTEGSFSCRPILTRVSFWQKEKNRQEKTPTTIWIINTSYEWFERVGWLSRAPLFVIFWLSRVVLWLCMGLETFSLIEVSLFSSSCFLLLWNDHDWMIHMRCCGCVIMDVLL